MNEIEYQKSLYELISDPARVYQTVSGKRLQFLSPGKLNNLGPDFTEMAVLINGYLIIGDCEFHINSSDWTHHRHETDDKYRNVVLHIVLNNDKSINGQFETLLIDQSELINSQIRKDITPNLNNIEELQHYALLRLLRKTTEAQKLLNYNTLNDTLQLMCEIFIMRYESRRHRPKLSTSDLSNLIDNIHNSNIPNFLSDISYDKINSLADIMLNLMKTKIHNEGPHFRRELILNAIIPLALALANEQNRINLFMWYWSTPAIMKYGILTSKFPDNPQNFLWQQQGMLEFMKVHGRIFNIVADSTKKYGLLEVLSFIRQGRLPLEFFRDGK